MSGVSLSTVELVGIGRSTPACTIANYPSGVRDATVALSNGAPIVCGGSDAEAKSCYKYEKSKNQWVRTPDMLESRKEGHTAVQINEKDFLIIGKQTNCSQAVIPCSCIQSVLIGGQNSLRTSEYYRGDLGAFEAGPNLIADADNHCAARFNDNTVAVTGGRGLQNERQV